MVWKSGKMAWISLSKSHVVIAPQVILEDRLAWKKPEAIIQHLLSTGPELVVLTMEEYGCFIEKSRFFISLRLL